MHPLPPALSSPSKSPVSFHSHGGTLWPRLPSRASSLQVPPSLCPDGERVPHRGAAWDPAWGADSCSPWESLIAPRCTSPPGRAAALYHAGVQTRRRVGLRAGTSPRLSPVRPARPGSQRALGLAYTAPHANLCGHGHHPRLQKRERGRARGDSAEAARSHSRRQDARAHVLRATASRRTRTWRPHPSCSGQGPSWPRRARAGSRTRAKPPVTVPCCGHPGARTALPRSGSSSQRPFQGRVMCPTQATTSRSSSAPGMPQRKAAPPR